MQYEQLWSYVAFAWRDMLLDLENRGMKRQYSDKIGHLPFQNHYARIILTGLYLIMHSTVRIPIFLSRIFSLFFFKHSSFDRALLALIQTWF